MNRIKEFREARGMTQQQLADLAGCHWITISKLERGETTLSTKWMEKLAPHLGVEAHQIYGGEGSAARLIAIEAKLDIIIAHMGITEDEIMSRVIDITDKLRDKREMEKLATATMESVRAKRELPVTKTFIKEWRQRAGYATIREFAMHLNWDLGALSRIETGSREPSLRQLTKIAELLSIEVGDLFKAPPAGSASA